MAKISVKQIVWFIFSLDISGLVIILTLLWTVPKVKQHCEKLCLPDNKDVWTCNCRSIQTHEYLLMEFHNEFTKYQLQKSILQNQDSTYGKVKKRSNSNSPGAKLTAFPNMELISMMKPKARVGGIPKEWNEELENTNGDLVSITKWRQDGNSMYITNGMTYRNGRLIVPFKGIYHVYTFIDMRCYEEDERVLSNKSDIRYAIFKSNIKQVDTPFEEEILIGSFKSHDVAIIERANMYDAFISADVALEAGDEVYVKVNNKRYIKYPRSNFFGMHLL